MSTLTVHKRLEALAQEPFSLDPRAWQEIRRDIDARIQELGAGLDWSDEAIEMERDHVPEIRAHLHVLNLQYIGIRGTNKVMRHLLADAATVLRRMENIQLACLQFEKTLEKYTPLRKLLGRGGAPEAHGQYLTLIESRFQDLTAELQQLREGLILEAARSDVELARRKPDCEEAMLKRLHPRPRDSPSGPDEAQTRLMEELDKGAMIREPVIADGDDMAVRVVKALHKKLWDEDHDDKGRL